MSCEKKLLEITQLSKSFKGVKAVNDVSFSVKKGEIVGIIGPNGAGKTSLFNLISGHAKPDHGRVFFENKNITNFRPDQVCKLGMGRTFQLVKPFVELTVLENVIIGALVKAKTLNQAKEISMGILNMLGLGDKNDQLAGHLTLPERKRLEVARALAVKPKILLLDEVMAGLRPSETDQMVSIFKKLNKKGLTILMIEHVMRAVINLTHHIVVLNYGEKLAEGLPAQVLKDPQVMKCYLGDGPYACH